MAKNEFLNFANGIGAAVMSQDTYANQAPLGVVPQILNMLIKPGIKAP